MPQGRRDPTREAQGERGREAVSTQETRLERENHENNTDSLTEICKDLTVFADSLKGNEKRKAGELTLRLLRVAGEKHESSTVIKRLDEIKSLIISPPSTTRTSSTASSLSWAGVAAKGMRQAGPTQTLQARRHTVRVQLTDAKEKNNTDILSRVKQSIPSAIAVRKLQSGDVDVTVPSEMAKDRAYTTAPTEELKVYRQDYLVEIPGVPLSVRVASGKAADNAHLARNICEASKSIAPGLQITRIR